ncbi:MAG TPA: selenide, water dikinase SelD, partial [Candidatus Deferrimicrobiaceae bacterium]|nr:selenide, water dikinase SelD [Candidatus Deferrimicrobiaceae bacterium]
AQAGDALILTKALGTGVISTAVKKEMAHQAWIDAAVQSMTTLNKQAAELIGNREYRVHGMTDVTGFGLIGHAREMALASNVALQFFSKDIAVLPGALDCIRAGYIPAGLNNNREFAECVVGYEVPISTELKSLLFDPQTAGGLLISVDKDDCQELVVELQAAGVPASRIGEVTESQKPLIRIY